MPRRRSERPKKNVVSVEAPKFFKVFMPNHSSDELLIPLDYVKRFGETLKENVTLKTEDGKSWCLGVKETRDGVYLKKGWQAFVDYHGLEFGEFLVFVCTGSKSFLVTIFGINGCKKETSESKNLTKLIKPKEEADQEEMKPEQTSRKHSRHNDDDPSSVYGSTDYSERFEEVNEVQKEVGSSKQPRNIEESDGPFITTTPRATRYHKLTIPKELIKKHKLKLPLRMILRNEKGKEWPVRVITLGYGVKLLGKGLNAFQVDNGVGPKDSCKLTFGTGKSFQTINVQVIRNVRSRPTHS